MVMQEKTNHATTDAGQQDQDQQLLASLPAKERAMVEWVMQNYPPTTASEALEELRAQGI